MRKSFYVLLTMVVLLFTLNTVNAAGQNADLRVQLQGQSTVNINTPAVYTATVTNLSNSNTTANNVQLIVDFPLTNTSPNVYILWNLSWLDQKCSIVSNKLSCSLWNIKKNKSVSINYTYTAPVSTKSLEMKASVSSSVNDNNTLNNSFSVIPNLVYPDRIITSWIVTNSHCTWRWLTAYFECLLFPSSISSHEVTLNLDNTITISEPWYTWSWSQPTNHQLHFEYSDVNWKVAEFNWFAINWSNCFDWITDFYPLWDYNSAYRVCLQ